MKEAGELWRYTCKSKHKNYHTDRKRRKKHMNHNTQNTIKISNTKTGREREPKGERRPTVGRMK